jgi:uncharacterized protein (TIGR02271 family)
VELSTQDETELFGHYGIPYRGETATADVDQMGQGVPRRQQEGRGGQTRGRTSDDAMTRSEERLSVGTRRVETGRARLRKYIVTETVTQTVPVSHEEIRVEREPITEANRDAAMAGGEITEEEHEVVLHAEKPVVAKETVPVERVRLDTETVRDSEQVSEEVRKEQIDEVTDDSRR